MLHKKTIQKIAVQSKRRVVKYGRCESEDLPDRTEKEGQKMKNPLRYQLTEYDCGPASMLNAISYLFERKDIPPEVIRNIMLYCLDCHSKEGVPGKRGTSRAAMAFLCNWLNEYGELGLLPISGEHIIGNGVCIGTESRINYALCHGGVAVVRLYLDEPHYVLMTGTDGDAIRMFDPYWLDHLPKEDIQITEDHPREYNRIVPVKYFNSESTDVYALGPKEEREAVILYNRRTKTEPEEVIEYFI